METRTDTEMLTQLGGLASFLSSRRQGILDAWRSAVLEDPELKTSSKVSVVHFEDSIPRMLESFERMLATASDGSRSRREEEKAHEHGAHRWLEGYSLRELVREWGISRSASWTSSTSTPRPGATGCSPRCCISGAGSG